MQLGLNQFLTVAKDTFVSPLDWTRLKKGSGSGLASIVGSE